MDTIQTYHEHSEEGCTGPPLECYAGPSGAWTVTFSEFFDDYYLHVSCPPAHAALCTRRAADALRTRRAAAAVCTCMPHVHAARATLRAASARPSPGRPR